MSDGLPPRTPFPGYDVLSKYRTPSWNDLTRRVVDERLISIPERSFLTLKEWNTLEAVCERLLPQTDRAEPIPIAPWIDRKLEQNQGDGYRYADMPPMRQAWRLGLKGLDQETELLFQVSFPVADPARQDIVLRDVQDGYAQAEAWRELPPQRFFKDVLLNTVVSVYYAHPTAWSEIGFGGPASPRGYVRTGANERDPWEAKEAGA